MIDLLTYNKIIKSVNQKILKQNKIKNILITGCGGMIGSYLVAALLAKKFKGFFNIYGYDVIAPKLDKKSVSDSSFTNNVAISVTILSLLVLEEVQGSCLPRR